MVKILTIAGSDSIGGAGIQQDIKTICSLGGYAMSVVTALTSQNTKEITDTKIVSKGFLKSQIDTVIRDIRPDGLKIGMLGNKKNAKIVCNILKTGSFKNVVYDPVLSSTEGISLFENNIDFIKNIFPYTDLITPNIQEAEKLTGLEIKNTNDMKTAIYNLKEHGCKNILIKGGHLNTNKLTDVLFYNNDFFLFEHDRIDGGPFHGTGCFLSSAICTFLAKKISYRESCEKAINIICKKMLSAKKIGSGQAILTF